MPYAVEVPSLSDELGLNFRSFWISRENLVIPSDLCTSGCDYQSIGKVDNARSSVWYANRDGNEIERTDGVYDILTCRKSI
jgi:hypothetical protein